MNWFSFLINFWLFASCAVCAYVAYQIYDGALYGGKRNAEFVHMFLSELGTIDNIVMIAYVALAVFAVVVRFRLAHHRADGPRLYISFQSAFGAAPLLAVLAYCNYFEDLGMEEDEMITYWIIPALIAVIIGLLVLANIPYFKNRKHLFVK